MGIFNKKTEEIELTPISNDIIQPDGNWLMWKRLDDLNNNYRDTLLCATNCFDRNYKGSFDTKSRYSIKFYNKYDLLSYIDEDKSKFYQVDIIDRQSALDIINSNSDYNVSCRFGANYLWEDYLNRQFVEKVKKLKTLTITTLDFSLKDIKDSEICTVENLKTIYKKLIGKFLHLEVTTNNPIPSQIAITEDISLYMQKPELFDKNMSGPINIKSLEDFNIVMNGSNTNYETMLKLVKANETLDKSIIKAKKTLNVVKELINEKSDF